MTRSGSAGAAGALRARAQHPQSQPGWKYLEKLSSVLNLYRLFFSFKSWLSKQYSTTGIYRALDPY